MNYRAWGLVALLTLAAFLAYLQGTADREHTAYERAFPGTEAARDR